MDDALIEALDGYNEPLDLEDGETPSPDSASKNPQKHAKNRFLNNA